MIDSLLEKLSLVEHAKWALFRVLERMSDLRGKGALVNTNSLPSSASQPALWAFVSTIGELNAIKPFLRSLCEQLRSLKLVLITDHEHYRAPYMEQFPGAVVYVTRGHSNDAWQLATHFSPVVLIVAEIPCLPSDAPCRFSYAFMRTAKQYGAKICLVNGWLYDYSPPCRMDIIENWLFRRNYVRLFDVACVQTDDIRQGLIRAGASPRRILVTGNIKFDAVEQPDWSVECAKSRNLVAALLAGDRPIIVAGCVTSDEEQQLVLDAFVHVKDRHPGALLVLAPRHPEYEDRIATLKSFLEARGVRAKFRSRVADVTLDWATQCLVLDTIGELRDFYAVAWVAYVGRNHNILEPLAFGKPVVVSGRWEPTYPSFPVYVVMREAGAILHVDHAEVLARDWLSIIESTKTLPRQSDDIMSVIDKHKGATTRCLRAVTHLVCQVSERE